MDALSDTRESRASRRVELYQRVELSLLPAFGDATAVVEWQMRGTRFNELKLAPSWAAARAWVEGHYEDVEWRNEVRGSGLIGVLADELD